MNIKKSSTNGFVPAEVFKQSLEVYLAFLTKTINQSITENNFPEQLKKLEAITLYKKNDPLKKENFTTVSLFQHLSEDFEKILYKKINVYMQDKLSKHITGLRISYGTKHSLNTMLEKWKATLAKWENICFIYGFPQHLWHKNHDLLLAKLRAYQFSIWNYLKNRIQPAPCSSGFN